MTFAVVVFGLVDYAKVIFGLPESGMVGDWVKS